MSKRAWIFLSNTFEVNTRTSKKKMLTLSTDTDSKLNNESADADILAIFNEYHPVHIAYRDMFQNYEVVAGERKGKTLNLETLMKTGLPQELRKWEAAVRTVYPEDSPEETEIFPRKRIPFLSGTYEMRIAAVGSLKQKLQADPAFTTLATQVASYHNLLLSARDTQQQKEGAKGQLSDLLEDQRLINADALYGIVLGQLMKKFRNDRQQIQRFFDLSLLRETGEEETIPATTLIIKGKVTDAVTLVVQPNIPVKLTAPDSSNEFMVITDANGDYEHRLDNLPENQSGMVTVRVENVPGYQTYLQNVSVTTGNSYTVNIGLLPNV